MSPLFGFTPSTLTVRRGTTVTWVNDDLLPQTVTSPEGAFASQAIRGDESFAFRFNVPGTYSYFSGFQPQMTGKIVVH
jgi:plastocyanin